MAVSNTLTAKSLSELQSAKARLATSQQDLMEAVREVVHKMTALIETANQTQNHQADNQVIMDELTKETANRTKAFEKHLNTLTHNFSDARRDMLKDVLKGFNNVCDDLTSVFASEAHNLAAITKIQQTTAEQQKNLMQQIVKHKSLKMYFLGGGFCLVQIILMLILIWLTHNQS